jgi:hypothetical protein
MTSASECRERAAIYSALARETAISIQRATILTAISRSWIIIAGQMDRLAITEQDEKLD